MARQEMPIFSKTFDFLQWLLPATHHFPRAHRYTFTQRLAKNGAVGRQSSGIEGALYP